MVPRTLALSATEEMTFAVCGGSSETAIAVAQRLAGWLARQGFGAHGEDVLANLTATILSLILDEPVARLAAWLWDAIGDSTEDAHVVKRLRQTLAEGDAATSSIALETVTALPACCVWRRGGELSDLGFTPEVVEADIIGKLAPRWRVLLGKCIDATPLVVCTAPDAGFVFIGSHAHNFGAWALDGRLCWEVTLGGRIESSAVLTR